MTSYTRSFPIQEPALFKQKMLRWANRHNIFCFLDNSDYSIQPHRFDCILAADAQQWILDLPFAEASSQLNRGHWYFGHLAYDLKNEWYQNRQGQPDPLDFPRFSFFEPAILIILTAVELKVSANDPDEVFSQILATPIDAQPYQVRAEFQASLSKSEYLEKIIALQNHIRRGDCYEINFCQEFQALNIRINPVLIYEKLQAESPNPFSGLYRLDDRYVICASPERFLLRQDDRILSQPMKGTIGRDPLNPTTDANLKAALAASAKDRAENVMVVDLVRNDLSRICREGSVVVDELFGIYSYPRVHQMISTVSGKLRMGISFEEIIRATFPMGSMTGAPKEKVMELIDRYESSARGIFSGSIGYIDPNGNFDWNVVIRSLFYHAGKQILSYRVGSGITIYSDPELEWEECLLKAEGIKKVLT